MKQIRNIAVIAHVDHGKTTLVDALLKQSNVFRDNQDEMFEEQIMDTNDLERERGITIMAKVCAIEYQDAHINIIDTPGHADFSGEVERTLGMAEGALLIVDAQEGPMPQTRFVLKIALELNLKIIVIINKIDKKFARVDFVKSRLADLFLELATKESQLDFPILYAVAKNGTVWSDYPDDFTNPGSVTPLLETILNTVPAPASNLDVPPKVLVSSLDYDNHTGRIAIGKVVEGILKVTDSLKIARKPTVAHKPKALMIASGMDMIEVNQAVAGNIVAIGGIGDVKIGDTLGTSNLEPLPAPIVSEPSVHMSIGPNTSPFAGREAQYTTSRQIEARLQKELENNVGLRVESLDNGKFKISGRGELHLSILLENMRREGYEMEVGKPQAIKKEIDGIMMEPVEEVNIIVDQDFVGVINQELGKRQAELKHMEPVTDSQVEFIYHAPTRTLIGLRSLLLTLTKGTVLFSSQITDFKPVGEPLPKLRSGAIIAATTGKAVEYGLKNLKGRGVSFISPGFEVYQGMIVGQNAKDDDIEMNVTKTKNLTNHRTKSHQGITQLAPDVDMTLEEAIDFLETDELLEITPKSLRLRKKHLTDIERRRTLSQSV